jgi:O-methyltransferase
MCEMIIRKIANLLGLDIVRYSNAGIANNHISSELLNIYEKVKPYTLTSKERVISLCEATQYVHKNNIEGDIVECGVWRGGSMLAVAETLIICNNTSKSLYLYDTFDGMPPPSKNDTDMNGMKAEYLLKNASKSDNKSIWCYASLDDVKSVLSTSDYPSSKIHYIKGMVEQTIPKNLPDKISILRLDTDWYESTKHELNHLFPRLTKGGVLILDDYGHWQGAKKAVDEYIQKNNIKILLNRVDYTGRIAVKVD